MTPDSRWRPLPTIWLWTIQVLRLAGASLPIPDLTTKPANNDLRKYSPVILLADSMLLPDCCSGEIEEHYRQDVPARIPEQVSVVPESEDDLVVLWACTLRAWHAVQRRFGKYEDEGLLHGEDDLGVGESVTRLDELGGRRMGCSLGTSAILQSSKGEKRAVLPCILKIIVQHRRPANTHPLSPNRPQGKLFPHQTISEPPTQEATNRLLIPEILCPSIVSDPSCPPSPTEPSLQAPVTLCRAAQANSLTMQSAGRSEARYRAGSWSMLQPVWTTSAGIMAGDEVDVVHVYRQCVLKRIQAVGRGGAVLCMCDVLYALPWLTRGTEEKGAKGGGKKGSVRRIWDRRHGTPPSIQNPPNRNSKPSDSPGTSYPAT
ncbi:hypothetical protein C7212DRAFT_349055 [Tuber magnatum]|uniref:Uncharacterized protein n=1 Tax=Tuber magnatum TaxID=42249 RepID=A0A317SFY3_9PEZI|nr:hypothetical protein C7212DRAFT_349055 [Tuber magnatum]